MLWDGAKYGEIVKKGGSCGGISGGGQIEEEKVVKSEIERK
jgi:hypothetical protein